MKKYWCWDENIYWFLVGEIYWFCDKKIYWFCDEEILKSKFREIFTLRGTFINGKIVQNFESVICSICKKNAFASTWERVICWIFRKCIYILDHHCFFLGRCVGRFGSFKSFFCNFIRFYDFVQYQLCFSSNQIVCFMNHHLIKLILSYITISYCAS